MGRWSERLYPWKLNGLAVVMLAILYGLALVWAGEAPNYMIVISGSLGHFSVRSMNGRFSLGSETYGFWDSGVHLLTSGAEDFPWNYEQFGWTSVTVTDGYFDLLGVRFYDYSSGKLLNVPHSFAVVPALWVLVRCDLKMRKRAKQRRKMKKPVRNICRKCKYDLRASVGRCPECGTAIPAGLGAGVSQGVPGDGAV